MNIGIVFQSYMPLWDRHFFEIINRVTTGYVVLTANCCILIDTAFHRKIWDPYDGKDLIETRLL